MTVLFGGTVVEKRSSSMVRKVKSKFRTPREWTWFVGVSDLHFRIKVRWKSLEMI